MASGPQRKTSGKPGPNEQPPVHMGRRTVLGILGLTGVGIALGTSIDRRFGGVISDISSTIGVPLPGADQFRFYTVTGEYPVIPADTYELTVGGMVRHPLKLNIADLRSMKRTKLVHRFQCVTGWYVPGRSLGGRAPVGGARARRRGSEGNGASGSSRPTASIPRASRSPRRVSRTSSSLDKMLGANVTSNHGGPVRLYVAPMYGYKSIKWMNRIEVTNEVVPGFWEDNGYPTDAWIGGVQES